MKKEKERKRNALEGKAKTLKELMEWILKNYGERVRSQVYDFNHYHYFDSTGVMECWV
jgi:hypothetical protein